MKTLTNYGEIRVTQRTAMGQDDSEKTVLCVVKNVYSSNEDIDIMTKVKVDELVRYSDAEIVGTVTIIHPWLLSGTWEENIADFRRIALRHLESTGALTHNDYGTYFLA